MAKKKKQEMEEDYYEESPYFPHPSPSGRTDYTYRGWTPIMHIQYIMRTCEEKWKEPADKEFARSHEFRKSFFGYSRHLSWSTIRATAKYHESREGFIKNIEGQIEQSKSCEQQKGLT